jgi:hypothetical protein
MRECVFTVTYKPVESNIKYMCINASLTRSTDKKPWGGVERKGRDEGRAYSGFMELYFLPTAVFSPQRSAFLSWT